MEIPLTVIEHLEKSINSNCCSWRVGEGKSLCLGFGKKNYHKDVSLIDDFRAEWEFRSFYSSWRIVKNKRILCSNCVTGSSINQLQQDLESLSFSRLEKIFMLSDMDISIQLSNGLRIDFIANDKDIEEDIISIFCPNNIFIGFSLKSGWEVCLSDVPKL